MTYTWAHTGSGNTTTKVDVGGNKTVYTFNSTPVVTQVQSYVNTGTVASPTYSSTPNLTKLYCYNGNSTSCATASVTMPIREVDLYTTPDNKSNSRRSKLTYDAYGNVLVSAEYDYGATTPTFTTTTVYAVNGSGNCSTIGAHVNNKPCSIITTDGAGANVTYSKFAYDASGNLLTRYVSKDGSTFLSNSTANVYNSNGTISKSFDLANHETDYTYALASYSDGTCSNPAFPTQVKNVTTGLATNYTYDCTGGAKLTATDANGNVTTYGYKSAGGVADPWWRGMTTTDPLLNESFNTYTATSLEGSFEFNSSSSIEDVISTLDGYGRVTQTKKRQAVGGVDYDAISVSRDFSGVNPTVFTSNPCSIHIAGRCITHGPTTAYDLLGRQLTVTQSGSNATDTLTYSQNDVLIDLGPGPTFDGENDKKVQSEYDGLGRVSKVCRIGNGSSTACGQNTGTANGVTDSYSYATGFGSVHTTVQRGSQPRDTYVDGLGRVVRKVTPEGGTWNFTYDTNASCPVNYRGVNGQLASSSDPNGNLICYAYDSLNRVTGVNANGTSCRHFYFDTSYGTVPTGVTTPTYTLGRLAEASTDNCSGTLATDEWFSYDKDGHVLDQYESTPNSGTYYHAIATFAGPVTKSVQLKNPNLFTSIYALDGEGRWNSLTEFGQTIVPASGVTFNAAGQPTAITIGSGTNNDAYTYDSDTLNMTGWTFTVGASSETGTLTWNPIGSLKSLAITDGFNSGGTQTCNFGVSGSQGYDDWSRLLYDSCGTGGATWNQTYSYDQYDNLTKASTGFVSWNPGYSSTTNHYTCTGCTYDSNGNVTNDGTTAYTWNEFSKMKNSNGGNTQIYDAFGRTVEIQGASNTQIWYTQLGKTAFMNGSTNLYTYFPTPGNGTVLHPWGGNYQYMHKDWLGSARLISSALNNIIISDRAIAPYGEVYNIFGSTSQNLNMFGDGSTQDVLAGMYDTPNRELQGSQQGRWLSPDPAGSGWNQYAYATNPNSRMDPSGLYDCEDDGGDCGGDGGGGEGGGGEGWGGYGGGDGEGEGGGSTGGGAPLGTCIPVQGGCALASGPGSGGKSVTTTLWATEDDGSQWFSTDGGNTWDLQIYQLNAWWGGSGNAYQGFGGVDSSVSVQVLFYETDGTNSYFDMNPGVNVSANQTFDGPTSDQTVLANVSAGTDINSVGTSIVQNPDGTISTQGTTFSESVGGSALGPWQVQFPLYFPTPQQSLPMPTTVQTNFGPVDINPCFCLQ